MRYLINPDIVVSILMDQPSPPPPVMNIVVDHLWTTTILTINIGKNILFIKSGSRKQLEKLSLLDNIFPHCAPPPQKKTHHLYVKVVPTSNSLLTFSSSSSFPVSSLLSEERKNSSSCRDLTFMTSGLYLVFLTWKMTKKKFRSLFKNRYHGTYGIFREGGTKL